MKQSSAIKILATAALVATLGGHYLASAPRVNADPMCCGRFLLWCVGDAGCDREGTYFCLMSGEDCIFESKDDSKSHCPVKTVNCNKGDIQQ